jgi:hypothetical protein
MEAEPVEVEPADAELTARSALAELTKALTVEQTEAVAAAAAPVQA